MFDRREAVRKLVLNAARLSGIAPLAGRMVGGIGAILMLHRVTREPAAPLGLNRHLAIEPEFLDELLGEMRRQGYRFVDMDEAVTLIEKGARHPFATVTADDGYRDNLIEALPVLEKHTAPITIYVAPGLVDGEAELWWEVAERIVERSSSLALPGMERIACETPREKSEAFRRIQAFLTGETDERDQVAAIRAIAADAGVDPAGPSRDWLMTWDEIERAASHPLVTIGAHTIRHVNLKRLSEQHARDEIVGAADRLAGRLGARPRHMAYPYGFPSAVGSREVRLAGECGFATAVTTRHGVLRPEHAGHLHALPRLSINGRYQDLGHVTTMLSGITTPLANKGRRVVTV